MIIQKVFSRLCGKDGQPQASITGLQNKPDLIARHLAVVEFLVCLSVRKRTSPLATASLIGSLDSMGGRCSATSDNVFGGSSCYLYCPTGHIKALAAEELQFQNSSENVQRLRTKRRKLLSTVVELLTYREAVVQLALPLVGAVDERVPLVGQLVHLAADAASQLPSLLLRASVPAGVPVQLPSGCNKQIWPTWSRMFQRLQFNI